MNHILILGGDLRQKYLGKLLKEEGFPLSLFWDQIPENPEELLSQADVILCPIPFTQDQETLFFPDSGEKTPRLEIRRLLSGLRAGQMLFGGQLPPSASRRCRSLGVSCFDYMKLESVACKNAAATAEGAIAQAILLSPVSLRGSRCLVTGWGRCAKSLAWNLSSLGAQVSIAVRRPQSCSEVFCFGLPLLSLSQLSSCIASWDVIFNTIPAPVLNRQLAQRIRPDAAVIDVASSPGGTDFDTLKSRGIPAKLCPGLPGLCSPLTSAKILRDAVLEQLSCQKGD